MARRGALRGLRVLDLTDESGRMAGKLLAEGGADVVRLRPGIPGASLPPADGRQVGGVLSWWFDGGTRSLPLGLATATGVAAFRTLCARADLLIETEPPGRLAELGLDFEDLHAANPALVQVSLTPFGRQGPRAGWQVTDIVANALGGILSVNGDPELPLNAWGRQAFNVGGFYAAICGLAGAFAVLAGAPGQHIDLSLHEAVISCSEQVLMGWFYQDLLPGVQREEPFGIYRRQRSLHWTGAYEVMACGTGHEMVCLVPGTPALIQWLAGAGLTGVAAQLTAGAPLLQFLPQLMDDCRAFVARGSAHELFLGAQQRHLAWAEVLSVAQASAVPQHRARRFFQSVRLESQDVQLPGPVFRLQGSPAPPASAPPAAETTVAELLRSWRRRASARAGSSAGLPLSGVRILDFTWVLAGPFATRILADLGADVIKIQTDTRSQGTNGSEHPYFAMWNRGKRSVTLNMKHPQAAATFRALAEQSDIVIENFSAGVLDRWGIGYDQARGWNEKLIYIGMSGPGRPGPWSDFVTYAPTIHALSGLTHLTGRPEVEDLGMGYSFNDHASGLAGALAALEALEARRRTGIGQYVELSQLEVGVSFLGPAFLDYLSSGREAQPAGNRDPFEDFVPNDVYRCRDGAWLAVSARHGADWSALCAVVADPALKEPALADLDERRRRRQLVDERLAAWAAEMDALPAMEMLQAAGVPAGVVQDGRDLTEHDPQLAARGWLTTAEHPQLGPRPMDRFPARFSGGEIGPLSASPASGQHVFEVYTELLGMTDAEIAAAIGDGLFA